MAVELRTPYYVDVALLAEGVDRNIDAAIKEMDEVASPSSRRAWIEINRRAVDGDLHKSPSSRRAWIEIDGAGAAEAVCDGRPPRGGRG